VNLTADLHTQLAQAARELHAEPDTQHTLDRSVLLATELISNCDHAGISMVHRNRTIDTPAASDQMARRGDELQYTLGEGPCLDAIWHYDTVICANLAEEDRWTKWAPRVAAELGVCSMLCLRLFTSTELVGGLNLYSTEMDAFDEDEAYTGTYLAAQIAVAVAETQQQDGLRIGALNRTIIGQAQGILMERYNIDAEEAFNVMRRVSQDNNIKLIRVADELVRTRRTPGAEPPSVSR
jgi:transcriptional regulator with GAF, ATPase, and Fis domain